MAVRKGDTVIVLSGKDRGKRGKVERVEQTRRGLAVVVPGINMAKRHQKSRGGRTGSQTAGIIDLPMPIQISNVMVVCPNCDKPTRAGHARLEDQHHTRVRVCKHCGEQLGVKA
jgi:large subunit ribosomal protein L24